MEMAHGKANLQISELKMMVSSNLSEKSSFCQLSKNSIEDEVPSLCKTKNILQNAFGCTIKVWWL